jgi:NADPH-dependent 2,4-dienoyl-CoA reductase/sulfur reductase-like enzyme
MFCIVGAGLAGDTAAAALRAEGYSGRILLIGEEKDPPYDRPPLSKEALYDDIPEDRFFLRAESWYDEQDIELKLAARIVGIDRQAHRLELENGETLAYDKLLLTTGARARSLPGAGQQEVPTFVLRELDDARALKPHLSPGNRIAIVGAGVIGLEVAASAIRRGCDVEVAELADRVLARVVPPPFSAFMADLHRGHGTRLHLSAGSVELAAKGIHSEMHGEIAADAVVIGIGVVPNDELARQAGLDCKDGIIVDAHARTSDCDIFAAGDVARYPCPFGGGLVRCENWKHAQRHAAAAAKAMLGQNEPYAAASSMWSDQFDLKLQTVGTFDGEEIDRGEFGGRKFMRIYRSADGRVIGAIGVNQAKEMRIAETLIEKQVKVGASLLADPSQDLRKLAGRDDR